MLKKIVFVITKSNWGGAQRYVYDLATSLPFSEYDPVVILGGDGILKYKLELKKVRTISLPSLQRDINIKKELLSFYELYKILKNEKPDIVHLNSSKAGGLGAIICRLLRIKKIIFTAHAWAFNENRKAFEKIIITIAHFLTVFFSHKSIAVSESVKNQISHLPFLSKKITVIHLGIHPPDFLDRNTARERLGIPNENYSLGTIAELHPIKGLEYAIEAISLLRPEMLENFSYHIIGEGEEREVLQNLVIKKNLQDKIKLVGFIDNASSYLKAFDLFILPSLSEALGYVLIEAGYAKVPVMGSNVRGIPEIIEDKITGNLFPAKDVLQIHLLLKDKMMSKNNNSETEALFKKVNTEFSMERMIDRTIDIYTGKD
jgi:glycosyltransferase involved in cell wall biosynthesis